MIYKFRAWDGGKMYAPIIDEYGNIYKSEYDFIERNHSDHSLMMFTGLHDKNGKELYYKDRVKELEYGKTGTIEFNDGCFGLVIDGESKYTPLFRFYRADIELEIIAQ